MSIVKHTINDLQSTIVTQSSTISALQSYNVAQYSTIEDLKIFNADHDNHIAALKNHNIALKRYKVSLQDNNAIGMKFVTVGVFPVADDIDFPFGKWQGGVAGDIDVPVERRALAFSYQKQLLKTMRTQIK